MQRSGNVSYVVDLGLVNFKRDRYSFKTKEEAETFADIKANERKNQGVAAIIVNVTEQLPIDVDDNVEEVRMEIITGKNRRSKRFGQKRPKSLSKPRVF